MAITVAQIKIEVQGDAAGATRSLQDAASAEEHITRSARTAAQTHTELSTVLLKATASVKDLAVGFAAAATGFTLLAAGGVAAGRVLEQVLAGGVKAITGAVFGMNASLETATLQFQTLMGNADLAKEHVEGLFKFAKETPFETAPVIQASLALRSAGGDALDTEKNLRLVGDAAAGVSAPIQEVAMWFGRAFSALQAGRPFGEAAERLQELNIISGTTRNRLESMQESGATSVQVFNALEVEFNKFSGSMKLQAGTWQGLTSTFADAANILISRAFRPLFAEAEDTLGRINEFLDTKAADTWADHMGAAIKDVISALGGAPQGADPLKNLLESMPQTIENAATAINTMKGNIDRMVSSPGFRLFLIAMGAQTAPEAIADIPSLFQRQETAATPPGRQVPPMSALDQQQLAEQVGGAIQTPAQHGFENAVNTVAPIAAATGEELAAAFIRGLARGEMERGLAKAGKDSIRLLQEVVIQGKPELAEAAGQAADAFRIEIEKGLGPFEGARLGNLYMDAVIRAITEKDPELAEAAAQLARDIGNQITAQQEAERVAAAVRQQQEAAKRIEEEAKRAAEEEKRRIHELAITGFIDERDKQAMVTQWGKLGSDSVVALSTALADPTNTRSAGEALARSVVDLTNRLQEAGVPEFRELGSQLMRAAEAALRGEFSQGAFQALLQDTIGHLPQLSIESVFDPTSFERALATSNLPSAAKHMGDLMRQNLKDGFVSTEAIADFQRSTGELLRITDALGFLDPEAARSYAEGLVAAQREALQQATPEAIAEFERFAAQTAGSIRLDVAEAEYRQKIDELVDVRDTAIARAKQRVIDAEADFQEQLAITLDTRSRQQSLQDELDQRIQSIRDEQQKETQLFQETEAAKQRALVRTREEEDRGRSQGREDRDVQIARQRAAAEAQLQLSRQIAEAQQRGAKPEEIAAIQIQFNQAQADRQRQQGYEDQDRARRRSDVLADVALNRQRQEQDLATQTASRQAAATLQTQQQERMHTQERTNQRATQALADQLAVENHRRQLKRLEDERDQAITDAQDRYDKEAAIADTALAKIRAEVLAPAWRQDLITWETEFRDPVLADLSAIAQAAGAAFAPPGFFPGQPGPFVPPGSPLTPGGSPAPSAPDEETISRATALVLARVMPEWPQEVNVSLDGEDVTDNVNARNVRDKRWRAFS